MEGDPSEPLARGWMGTDRVDGDSPGLRDMEAAAESPACMRRPCPAGGSESSRAPKLRGFCSQSGHLPRLPV